jgi:hypothetical protein
MPLFEYIPSAIAVDGLSPKEPTAKEIYPLKHNGTGYHTNSQVYLRKPLSSLMYQLASNGCQPLGICCRTPRSSHRHVAARHCRSLRQMAYERDVCIDANSMTLPNGVTMQPGGIVALWRTDGQHS